MAKKRFDGVLILLGDRKKGAMLRVHVFILIVLWSPYVLCLSWGDGQTRLLAIGVRVWLWERGDGSESGSFFFGASMSMCSLGCAWILVE
jgi:hypothetical protein